DRRSRKARDLRPRGLGRIWRDGKGRPATGARSDMWGHGEEEFRAMTTQVVTADATPAQLYQQISDLLQDKVKSFQMERELLRKDGSTVWALLSVSLVRDERNAPRYFIGQAQDISERKTMEIELSLAKQPAATANMAKTEFLTTMSHELRTPMNGILGFAQLLETPVFGALTVKQGEFVQAILRSGRHLLDLINDILELSKIEAGKLSVSVERVEL